MNITTELKEAVQLAEKLNALIKKAYEKLDSEDILSNEEVSLLGNLASLVESENGTNDYVNRFKVMSEELVDKADYFVD